MKNRKDVYKSYEIIAHWYDQQRGRTLFERPYLDLALDQLKANSSLTVLDLGCGMGEPIGRYLIERGADFTGVDGSEQMVALAKARFPASRFLVCDMRKLALNQRFDLVLAWDSFFHLPFEDQPQMFGIFADHLRDGGVLLFTSGPDAGEVWSNNGGEELYHASLAPQAYKELLHAHGLTLLKHVIEDKSCHGHTVWMAQKS